MKKIINVHISKGNKDYVAECLDLPVVTQAKTLDELMFNIKEAIELHLEDEDLNDYDLVTNPKVLASIEFGELEYT